MSSFHRNLIRTIWLCLIASFLAVANAHAQDAKIDLSHLDRFADKADKVIDVTVDENIIKLALAAINPNRSKNEAKIKELLAPLKGIYVRRFQFEKEGEYTVADANSIRSQLNAPGWQRIANVRSKKEGSFDVVIMTQGTVIHGLAVFAAEPKALTVVNIVGPIDLAKLAELEGSFGIPKFGLEQATVRAGSKDKEEKEDKTGSEKKPPNDD
jgi:hypothetical protein